MLLRGAEKVESECWYSIQQSRSTRHALWCPEVATAMEELGFSQNYMNLSQGTAPSE